MIGEITQENFEILDHMPMGAFVLREDFVVVFWNSYLEDWTGIPRGKIVGENIGKFYSHLKESFFTSRLKTIFEGGPPIIFSSHLHKNIIPITLPNQKIQIQHTTVTALPQEDIPGFYALFSIQDVTELKGRIHDYRVMRDRAQEEIKERKRAEAAVRESEKIFRQTFEAIPDPAILWERQPDGRITLSLFNSAAHEFSEGDIVDLLDVSVEEFFRNTPRASDKVKEVFETGETQQQVELTFNLPSGESRNLLADYVKAGENYVLNINRDVTEERQYAKKLKISEERYELATGASETGVWDWNLQTNEFYLDPNVKAILGYSDEEIPNDIEIWSEYIHPEDKEEVMNAAKEHLEGKTSEYVYEHRMLHKDGSVRWILVRGKLIRDSEGKPIRMVGTDTNITKQKQLQQDLRESEMKWRTLFDSLPGGSFIVDEDYRIQDVNTSLCEISGFTKEELIGQLCNLICPKGPHACPIFDLGKAGITNDETAIKTKDNRKVPIIKSARQIQFGGKEYILENFQDITERKRIEEELKRSERMNRAIIENSPLGISIRNPEGKLMLVNRAWKEIWNLSDEDIEKYEKKSDKLNFKERFSYLKDYDIEKVFESGGDVFVPEVEISEYDFANADWISLRIYTITDSDGNIERIISITEDISQRRKIKQNLQNNLSFLEALLDTIPSPIFYKDGDGVYLGCNNAFAEKILGRAKEEIRGMTLSDLRSRISEEWREIYRQKDLELLENPGTQFYESQVMCADGIEREFAFFKATYTDALNNIAGIVGVMLDITERKHMEEALKANEKLFRSLFENNYSAMCLVDPENGEILDVNQAASQFYGRPKEELISMNIRDINILSPEDEIFETFRLSILNKKNHFFFNLQLANGEVRDVEIYSSVIEKYGKKLLYIIIHDVTERRLAHEKIRNLSLHLQSIREQERDIIAKEIDYELGQPLAALQMDLYLLKNKMLKSKNKEEMLQKLESMTQLVKMTLGKLKNMITELWPPILDNLGIVATLEYHLGKFKQRTGIKTELYIEPEDLELNKEYSVAFFRIFQELLKNVEEHSEADQVNVFLTQTSGAVELRIEDTGKGITQEEVSSEKSLGLLAIKERIKFWNGKFEINGIPGEGTVVINKIPLNHEVDKND